MSISLHALLSFGVDFFDSLRNEAEATSEQEIPVELVPEIPGTNKDDSGPGNVPPATSGETKPAEQAASPASEPPSQPQQRPAEAIATQKPPTQQPAPIQQQPRPPGAAAADLALKGPAPAGTSPPAIGNPAAAVEVPSVTRPDQTPQAKDAPAPPPLGKPTKDEIEHLFLPDLFKVIAKDDSPVASKEEADSYKAVVFDRIIRGRQYPESARKRGAHGIAIVSMMIDAAGNLGGASVVRSTGDRDLDIEAIAMIKRAAPFPVPPPGSVLTFTPMIEFGLE